MLSEEAVLGFEYGYSLAEPNALTLVGRRNSAISPMARRSCSTSSSRRANANGCACPASSACCRMAMKARVRNIPPRASSAILQMCAEDNMQVANCTNPANYFHILRRQLKRDIRKPLILMTPKSLLRHKRAVSKLDEFAGDGHFRRLLSDHAETEPGEAIKLVKDDKIRRIILCTGKVYYDLYEEREKRGIDDVYLLRVEQLYPLPLKALVARAVALQESRCGLVPGRAEEHGRLDLRRALSRMGAGQAGGKSKRARYVGRPASAATAAGTMSRHLAQLKAFLDDAFAI